MALYDDFLNQYLGQGMDVMTNKKMPTELPEYKYLSSDLTSQYSKQLAELMKTIGATGLTGGGVGKLLSDVSEGGLKANLGGERAAWEGTMAGTTDIAKFLKGLAQQAYEAQAQRNLTYLLTNKQIKTQRQMAKMSAMQQGIPGAKGCDLCMIFITANCLTCQVKQYRDEHFSQQSYIAKGYKQMARWLIPAMLKHKTIKKIVNKILHPFVVFAKDYYEDRNTWATILCQAYCTLICLIWDTYGRVSAISERPLLASRRVST